MTHRAQWLIAGALLALLPGLGSAPLPFGGAPSPEGVQLAQGGEAERARRELQRQQRVTECRNRILAQHSRYASQAEFLRASQACAASR